MPGRRWFEVSSAERGGEDDLNSLSTLSESEERVMRLDNGRLDQPVPSSESCNMVSVTVVTSDSSASIEIKQPGEG